MQTDLNNFSDDESTLIRCLRNRPGAAIRTVIPELGWTFERMEQALSGLEAKGWVLVAGHGLYPRHRPRPRPTLRESLGDDGRLSVNTVWR
jgi:hypothetical protein